MMEKRASELPKSGSSVYLGLRKVELYGADLTVDQSVELDLGVDDHKIVEIIGSATAETSFLLYCSADGEHWYEISKWSGVKFVHEGLFNAMRYIRFKSLAAGSPGDLVDLIVSAMG